MRPIYPEPLPVLDGACLIQEEPGAVGAASSLAVAFYNNILFEAVITAIGMFTDTLLCFEEDLLPGGAGTTS